MPAFSQDSYEICTIKVILDDLKIKEKEIRKAPSEIISTHCED